MRTNRARRRAAGALALALSLVACTGEEPQRAERASQVVDDGGWTVLQYAMADNDLEPFMMADLDELAAVPAGNDLAVTAYVDRAAGRSEDSVMGLQSWDGARVLDIAAVAVRPSSRSWAPPTPATPRSWPSSSPTASRATPTTTTRW
jgi:hypothetical protein